QSLPGERLRRRGRRFRQGRPQLLPDDRRRRQHPRVGPADHETVLTGKQALMAGRILNRRELREQADQAERSEAGAPEAAAGAVPAAKGAKAKAAPKPKKPRKVKAPVRMRARWCLFDASMKQVAIFDYNQRAA